MRTFFRGLYELARAAARGRLDEALLELAIANEEASLEAGDFESARAVWQWSAVRWARRHWMKRRRAAGFSEVTIEAELDELRARVRRELADIERRMRERRS